MDAFYRLASGGSSIEQFARDVHTKGQLTTEINRVVKALSQDLSTLNSRIESSGGPRMIQAGIVIPLSETSSLHVSELCHLLEASLLHGLKEKLSLSKMTAAVLGPRSPVKNKMIGAHHETPEGLNLDFWPIILILCHNQVSENVMKLCNIYTDVGRCRAWMRITLNEGLFGSYMEALTNDTSLLHGFYRSSAYIRDRDHMDLLKSLLEELDTISFQMNYDCSTLNSWSPETLHFLGVHVPSSPTPVVAAVDALDELRRADERSSGSKGMSRRDRVLRKNLRKSLSSQVSRGSSTNPHLQNNHSSHDNNRRESSESRSLNVSQESDGGSSSFKSLNDDETTGSSSLLEYVSSSSTAIMSSLTISSHPRSGQVPKGETDNRSHVDHPQRSSRGNLSRPVPEVHRENSIGSRGSNNAHVTPSINITRPSFSGSNAPSSNNISSGRRERVSREGSEDVSLTSGNSISRKTGWSSSPPLHSDVTSGEGLDYSSMVNKYVESTEVVLSSTPDMRDVNFSTSPGLSSGVTQAVSQSASAVARSPYKTKEEKINDLTKSETKRFMSVDSKKSEEREKREQEVIYTIGAIGEFEVIPKSVVLNNSESETQEFLMQLPKLSGEVGLDEQDFKCNSCGRPIGMIYGKSRICKFDGYNYCTDCHSNDLLMIPAKIILNWDFKRYPVSKRNKEKLQLTECEALLDLKISSPHLYQAVADLAVCLDLRTQLFYFHAYIFTCQESVALDLRKIVWPKEHLFEHIHLYSCHDLIQVANGTLLTTIRKAIKFSRNHVMSCKLCSQKGFICELCKSSHIIYPFDTQNTIRCDSCKAVFHSVCVKKVDPPKVLPKDCPRCIRIEKRRASEYASASNV